MASPGMTSVIIGRSGGRGHGSIAALVILVAVLALAAPRDAAADWPLFGRDLGNSRSAGTEGPTVGEVKALQRAWTFNSSNGDFTGTPVVAAGTLVAGTNLGSIFALDAA